MFISKAIIIIQIEEERRIKEDVLLDYTNVRREKKEEDNWNDNFNRQKCVFEIKKDII